MGDDSIHSTRIRLRLVNVALILICGVPTAIAIIFSIPIVGQFAAYGTAHALGCTFNEAEVHACMFLGHDFGNFLYGYLVSAFVAGAANPLIVITGIASLPVWSTAGWLLACVLMFVFRRRMRRSLRPEQ
jgi:hypothetical protein